MADKSNLILLDFDIDVEEELGILILDEIHWISDKSRGHVWEEGIMETPETVQILGLSATVSKVEKLANMLILSNKKKTEICGCNERAVDLYHYSFMTYPESAEQKFNTAEKAYMSEMREKLIPLKRIGKPQDIANSIIFLLSDQSSYVTGTEIIVDGGITAKP